MAECNSTETRMAKRSTRKLPRRQALLHRGYDIARCMLIIIQANPYKYFSLREYERRQEGQKSGPQHDIVGKTIRQLQQSEDPMVLKGFTRLLTDYLMSAGDGANDLEVYENMQEYMEDHTADIDA